MARKPYKTKYQARNGATQYKPSMEFLMSLDDTEGFCLACANTQSGVEPDAGKYHCENCGENKVYGRETLILLGLVF